MATAQTWAVTHYELRRMSRSRQGRVRLAFLMLPALLTAAWAAVMILRAEQAFTEPLVLRSGPTDAASELGHLAQIFRFFVLPFVLYLGAADLFCNLYRSEISERTLHHLYLMPVRRELVALGKYAAGVIVLSSSAGLVWLLSMVTLLLPHGASAALHVLLSGETLLQILLYLLVILLATASYGALFLAAGVLIRAPLLLAASFWAWERFTVILPRSFKMASLFFHLESLMPVRVAPQARLANLADPSPAGLAIPLLLLVSLLGAGLAAWLTRGTEVRYSGGE